MNTQTGNSSAQVIVCEGRTVHAQQGPFSNKFIVRRAEFEVYEGVEELHVIALCTEDSAEPGRLYSVNYSLQGELMACTTLN